MATRKTALVKLDEVKNVFFVRRSLNRALVETLAAAYEAGETIPPIVVNQELVLIDGRHRMEAAKSIGKESLEAQIKEVTDEAELIRLAAEANGHGPMPLLKQDYGHIVSHFIDHGFSVTRIQREILPWVPLQMLRKMTKDSLQMREAQQWRELRRRIASGEDVQAAAVEVGLSPEVALEQLGMIKRSLLGILGNIPTIYQSATGKVTNLLNEFLGEFQEGRISADELQQVLNKCFRGANQHLNALRDWERRVLFAVHGAAPIVKPETKEADQEKGNGKQRNQ